MLAGQLVAERFEIDGVVGGGGMGMVFAARDRVTGRRVALKVVNEQVESRDRFLQEGRMLSDLSHPCIVRYVAHGVTATGELYLAMEWLEGETLSARLRAGPLTLEETVSLGRRISEALAHAHVSGIIHRDVKPSNILLVDGDPADARLLDFGVARFARAAPRTQSGAVIGTPGYMSPEQAAGQTEIDARADLYGLGCVLYECLTGRPPFQATTAAALFAEITFAEPPRLRDTFPGVPPTLDQLVAALMAKRPEDRPPAAVDVVAALTRDIITGETHELLREGSRLTQREQRLASIVLCKLPPNVGADPGLAEIAAAHGARHSRLPDGSFVATLTGWAIATDLVSQAARCALAFRAARPGAPVAAATGRSLIGARFPVGEAIERAGALLAREAPAAGVRVDEITAGLLDARFELAGDEIGLCVVSEREPFEPARKLLGRATPCVGRERELGQLDALLAECIEEPLAQAVVITGAPGVGKSRLRHEFLARAKLLEAQVWQARGDSMRAGSPYGVVADLVRNAASLREGEAPAVAERRIRARFGRHLPAAEVSRVTAFLGELVGLTLGDESDARLSAARQSPAIMGDQIQRAWEDLLAAETQAGPLVLVVEDLQWGDVPSVRLLDSALRVLEESPLLVVALARPDIQLLFPNLWAGRRTHELRLGELRRKAGERLIAAVLGADVPEETVANLVSLSGGNVFHLEELIRAVAEGNRDTLPQTVLAMAHARLESLEPEARQLLRAASVYGEAFWAGGVRALVGEEVRVDSWLEDLTRREVLTARATSRFAREKEYAFRHALVREAADAALTVPDRRLGHKLAAGWLERNGETDPMVLAEHWERAEEPAAAVRFYLAAAEQALRGNDLTSALARAERGVACGAAGETLGLLHLLRAETHRWRGDFVTAVGYGNEAVAGLPPASASWYLAVGELATCAGLVGAHDRLEALARELRAAAREVSAPLVIAGARAAVQLFHAGRFAMGTELCDWLEERAHALKARDPSVAGWLGRARSIQGSKIGDWDATLAACARSAEDLDAAGDIRTAVLQRMNLGDAQCNLGIYAESERTLRTALAHAERLGLSHVIAPAKQLLAKTRAGQGALTEGIELGREAAALFREQGERRGQALAESEVASYLGRMGQRDEAVRAARAAVEVAASGSVRAACLTVLADVLLGNHRPEEARRAAAEGMELLAKHHGIDERETWLRLVWARSLLATEDRAGAAAAIEAARARLLAQIGKVRDPLLRQTALARVPENAGTLALAEELVP